MLNEKRTVLSYESDEKNPIRWTNDYKYRIRDYIELQIIQIICKTYDS